MWTVEDRSRYPEGTFHRVYRYEGEAGARAHFRRIGRRAERDTEALEVTLTLRQGTTPVDEWNVSLPEGGIEPLPERRYNDDV